MTKPYMAGQTAKVVIRNEPNNFLTRYPCCLCGGHTEKQSYLFGIREDIGIPAPAAANPLAAIFRRGGGLVVCDECAGQPGDIPATLRDHAAHLREQAAALEAAAQLEYVTEVAPIPDDLRDVQDGMYSEDNFAPWMREQLGLPSEYAEDSEGCRVWVTPPAQVTENPRPRRPHRHSHPGAEQE